MIKKYVQLKTLALQLSRIQILNIIDKQIIEITSYQNEKLNKSKRKIFVLSFHPTINSEI